ncbi:hypothetical protein BH24CHL4_BH24CHL4_18070 [soil metagenome]
MIAFAVSCAPVLRRGSLCPRVDLPIDNRLLAVGC